MALILTIETATKLCSAAVGRDGKLLALRETDSPTNVHAEKLNVFVQAALQEAGVGLNELDAVAVGIGPGSFTGLRIGLSAAKGFCYALDIPLIGLSTLGTLAQAAMANGSLGTGTLWPMVDARRMEVFTRPYTTDLNALDEAAPLILDDAWAQGAIGSTVFGDGANKAKELWQAHPKITYIEGIVPSAQHMLVEAEKRFASAAFDDLAYLVPDYGKAANVGQGKKV